MVAPKLSLLCVYGGSAMGPQCRCAQHAQRQHTTAAATAPPSLHAPHPTSHIYIYIYIHIYIYIYIYAHAS